MVDVELKLMDLNNIHVFVTASTVRGPTFVHPLTAKIRQRHEYSVVTYRKFSVSNLGSLRIIAAKSLSDGADMSLICSEVRLAPVKRPIADNVSFLTPIVSSKLTLFPRRKFC